MIYLFLFVFEMRHLKLLKFERKREEVMNVKLIEITDRKKRRRFRPIQLSENGMSL